MSSTIALEEAWVPVSSLVFKGEGNRLDVHRHPETGLLRETHVRLGRDGQPFGAEFCIFFHEATTTYRQHMSAEDALAEAEKHGWRRLS